MAEEDPPSDSLFILEEAKHIFESGLALGPFEVYYHIREKQKEEGQWRATAAISPKQLSRLRSWDYFLHRLGYNDGSRLPVLATPPF